MPVPRSLVKGFAKVVANTKPDPGKRLTISDPDTRGLYLRVTPNGHKSYTIVALNPAGKQVWAAVGNCDDLDLEEARTRAREGVKRIKAGLVPFPKVVPAKVETFQDVCDNFLTRYVDKKGLRSAPETRRIFSYYVSPRWGSKEFTKIKRGDVARLLDTIEDENGPVMADRVLAALSKLFNWYATREDDYVSPVVRGMRRANAKERARKRVLSDDEIRLVWKAAHAAGTLGAFVQTGLLTAQRRGKLMTMKWAEIDDKGVWSIPAEAREKSSAGELKLPELALAIINARPKVKDNPYVFAGNGERHFVPEHKAKSAFHDVIAKLNDGDPIPHWTIHDLRRTAKSLMARAGVRPDVSERVLGHVIQGVEGVYDRHSYADEKAEALEKLAGLVALILNPPKGNVVQIERRAG
jgi:integrase